MLRLWWSYHTLVELPQTGPQRMPVADKRALSFSIVTDLCQKVVLTHLRRPLVRFGAEGARPARGNRKSLRGSSFRFSGMVPVCTRPSFTKWGKSPDQPDPGRRGRLAEMPALI